jgi:hypothetical protein
MKITQWNTLALTVIFLAQPLVSAHAYILKNPVDLSPTALQNSGATYGPNVVTNLSGTKSNQNEAVTESEMVTFDEMPAQVSARDAIITDPVTDNDDVPSIDTVRSSAVLENPKHVSETTVATAQYAQQQQQLAPKHGTLVDWSIAAFAALIIFGIFYAARKRDPYTRIN